MDCVTIEIEFIQLSFYLVDILIKFLFLFHDFLFSFDQEIDLAPWIWDALERSTIREAYQRRLVRLQEARGINEVANSLYSIDSPEEKDYEDDLEKKIGSETDSVPLRPKRETESNVEDVTGEEKANEVTGDEAATKGEGVINAIPNIEPKKEKFKPRVNCSSSFHVTLFSIIFTITQ